MAPTTAATEMTDHDASTKLWGLLFQADVAYRYYSAWESFLFRIEKAALFGITIVSLLATFDVLPHLLSIIAFLIGTALILTDPAKGAASNRLLREGFHRLLMKLEDAYLNPSPTIEEYRTFQRQYYELAQKEGREYYRAVEATCHNDVIRVRKCDQNSAVNIPYYVQVLRFVFPFSNLA